MKAKVTKAFPGVVDGQSTVREIAVGETIHGNLAEVAVREKWAEEIKDERDQSKNLKRKSPQRRRA